MLYNIRIMPRKTKGAGNKQECITNLEKVENENIIPMSVQGFQKLRQLYNTSLPINIIGTGNMTIDEFQKLEGCENIGIPYKFYCTNNLYRNDDTDFNFMIFVNISLPYPEWYTSNPEWELDEKTKNLTPLELAEKAGMSFAHYLIVPTKPLFNAVILDKNHITMLENMKKEFLNQINNPEFKDKTIKSIIENINNYGANKTTFDTLTVNQRKQFYNDAATFLNTDYDESNTKFYVHVAPCNSINQLHIHVLQKNLRTSYLHDYKNMPLNFVIQYLEESMPMPTSSNSSGGNKKKNKKL